MELFQKSLRNINMRDLNKLLPVEELDEESWKMGRSARAAKVAAMPVSTPTEKGIQRQYDDIDKTRNLLEELLFMAKKSEIKQNDEDRKDIMVKKIRELLYVNHEQEAYLQIARECNYETADKFRAMDSENSEFGEEIKKRVDEAKKGFKATAVRSKPYGKNERRPYTSWDPAPGFMQNMGYNTYSYPAQGYQQNFGNLQPTSMSMMTGMQQPVWNDSASRFPKYQGRKIDKSKSTCKVCLGIGHWVGDVECPMNGFGGMMQLPGNQVSPVLALTYQPPPPEDE